MNALSFGDILATITAIVFLISLVLAVALGLDMRLMGDEDEVNRSLAQVGIPLIILVMGVILLFVNGRINEFEAFETSLISITIGCIIFSLKI